MADTPQDSPSPDTASQDWGNYWQGRTASEAGAALVGAGVETNDELAAFWTDALASRPRDEPLLDVATGAGTVLRTASALGFNALTGLDISPDALATLARDLPDVTTVVASAARPPFGPATFGTLTSQFGLEYAGANDALAALLPLLRPGGSLIAVCHHAGGAIADEVRGKRNGADALLDSGFVAHAKAVFRASDTGFDAAAARFGAAQDVVMARARTGDTLAANLYGGTQQLWERRDAYALTDIEAWLEGMASEILAFRGRMDGMLGAAQNSDDMHALKALAEAKGFRAEAPAELSLQGRTAAWVLRIHAPD